MLAELLGFRSCPQAILPFSPLRGDILKVQPEGILHVSSNKQNKHSKGITHHSFCNMQFVFITIRHRASHNLSLFVIINHCPSSFIIINDLSSHHSLHHSCIIHHHSSSFTVILVIINHHTLGLTLFFIFHHLSSQAISLDPE